MTEFIEDDIKEGNFEEVVANFNKIRGRVKRMEKMISGILEFSQVSSEKSQVERVDLNELLKEVIDSLNVPEAFIIEFKSELPILVCSRIQLYQVFSNLLSNAIKYNDKAQGIILIDYAGLNSHHEISIEDNGPGIAENFREKVFEIFQTLNARDRYESTGIGLSIVKQILENMGGSVRIESAPVEGAKFIVSMPVLI